MRIGFSGAAPIFCECQQSYIVDAHEGGCNTSYAIHAVASIFTGRARKSPPWRKPGRAPAASFNSGNLVACPGASLGSKISSSLQTTSQTAPDSVVPLPCSPRSPYHDSTPSTRFAIRSSSPGCLMLSNPSASSRNPSSRSAISEGRSLGKYSFSHPFHSSPSDLGVSNSDALPFSKNQTPLPTSNSGISTISTQP